MYLLIDYRERDFIKRLSDICVVENDIVQVATVNNCEVQFRITNLPVGDFIITEDLELTNNPNGLRLVIERKTIGDLCSSITDGRFREQKTRLLQSVDDTTKICYMIQGSKRSARMSQTVIIGAITNLLFRHNYRVLQTENDTDTFQTVVLLYKKWLTDAFTTDTVTNNVKLISKSDRMNTDRFIHQLCLVPGVSVTVAEAIKMYLMCPSTEPTESDLELHKSELVPSLKTLIHIYDGLPCDQRESYFSNVKVTSTRKIGPALSKKIYMYFYT